jgi:hypothetical protein
LDPFDELRRLLVDMKYDEREVDFVLAQMRAEEELQARHSAAVQCDSQAKSDGD